MFAAELPRYLDKLWTWVRHLSDLLILMWWINLILRDQNIVLMLRVKTPHVFTMSNNTTVGICNYHFFRISTWLNCLRNMLTNVMTSRIDIYSIETRIVRLRRLSIIEGIWLQMMCTRRSFIHIWNLILIFLIIRRLNSLWNTIDQFVLLLNWLFTNRTTVSLNRTLILVISVILTGVSSTAASDIITCYLRAPTVDKFGFPLLLCLINICLSISLWNLLFHTFTTSSTNGCWFCWHRLLLMLFNLTSLFLRNSMLILRLLDNLNSRVLRK